ncbi:MAG: BatD family protein [Acuticoccus sp.]
MSIPYRAAPLAVAAALVIGLSSFAQAAVTASLVRERVAEGDPVVLNITTDAADAAAPDLAPLDTDFVVEGTSQSSSTTIVNGNVSRQRGWAITLTPRSLGTLTIPAITVGGETTQPLTVEVMDAAKMPRASLDTNGLEVEMAVAPGTYYVQQEIPVTIRVTTAAGIAQATLSEPQAANALVSRTGEDKTNRTTIGGQPVTVIERTYLVTPQESGALRIPPVTLKARVPDPNGRRSPFGNSDPFARMRQQMNQMMPGFSSNFGSGFGGSLFDDMMNPGREIVARSAPVTLDIQPRPADASGWFLPAKSVDLRASWEPAGTTFAQGEAAQRIVQIVALGASKEQLPDLTFADVPGAQVYVERVDDLSRDTPDGTAAIKQYTLSVVPTRGGEVTLPQMSVEWLDAASGEQKTAVLPAETIAVEGEIPQAAPAAGNGAAAAAGTPAAPREWSLPGGGNAVQYGIAGALGLALLAALALIVRRATRARPAPAAAASPAARRPEANPLARAEAQRDAEMASAANAVRKACRANDAAAALGALTQWLRLVGATPRTLKGETAAPLVAAIDDLERSLYGVDPTGTWRGDTLAKAFDAALAERAARGKGSRSVGDLPPLYASDDNRKAA